MNRKSEKSDFMVALNSATCGHLVFLSDVAWLTILTDPSLQGLARGSFEEHLPRVRVEESTIIIECGDLPSRNMENHSQKHLGAITLNPSVPWEIEFRGRATNIKANLRHLELRSLDLLGGTSQVELLLSRPVKTSFIYMTEGMENSAIHVPAGLGIRVQVNGLVKHLCFDGQHFDATGGKTSLENVGFQSADSRYDICITGRISNVTIDEETPSGFHRSQPARIRSGG
jgi:hypothetical protein